VVEVVVVATTAATTATVTATTKIATPITVAAAAVAVAVEADEVDSGTEVDAAAEVLTTTRALRMRTPAKVADKLPPLLLPLAEQPSDIAM
jgi:hypothetical protein